MFFVTKFVTCITKFVTCVRKFVTCITKFVINFFKQIVKIICLIVKNISVKAKSFTEIKCTANGCGGLKAQLLPLAQGNALGKRTPLFIHSAFRGPRNATRPGRVTPIK